jgi:hypothetical protein
MRIEQRTLSQDYPNQPATIDRTRTVSYNELDISNKQIIAIEADWRLEKNLC